MSEIPPQPPDNFVQYPRQGYGPAGIAFPPNMSFDVIGVAWKLVQRNLIVWIAAEIILALIGAGLGMVVGLMIAGSALAPHVGVFPSMQELGQQQVLRFPLSILLAALRGGLYNIAIKQARGQEPSINDMFEYRGQFGQLLLAALLMNVAIVLGLFACLLPGLLIGTLVMFTMPLILDKRMSAMDAMKLSVETVRPQMWMGLAVLIVAALASMLGLVLCCVGVLVTIPILTSSIAVLYQGYFGEQAPPSSGALPPFQS